MSRSSRKENNHILGKVLVCPVLGKELCKRAALKRSKYVGHHSCTSENLRNINAVHDSGKHSYLISLGAIDILAAAASPEVASANYYSYLYDRMRADDAQEGEVPEETDEVTKPTTIKRYVYVYPADGRYEAVFEDRYMGLTDVSDLIDPSPKVSATYYYIVAGILLLAGAYLLFLAFTGKRTPERPSRPTQTGR